MSESRYPSPPYPTDSRFMPTIKGLLETAGMMLGRRGDLRDRMIRVQDLLDLGIVNETDLAKLRRKI